MKRFYSQNGEDFLLWNYFNFKHDGFFVDVGAFDGIHFSNTYSFELQGWTGICIEPNPNYSLLCETNRPNSTCISVACTSSENIKTVDFYLEKLGLLSGLNGSNARITDVQQRYAKRGLQFDDFERIKVPSRTLNSILHEHLPKKQSIDFLSIDVEGRELDVLIGLDLRKYRPKIIVIEANTGVAQKSIKGYLRNWGYLESRRVSENLIFVTNMFDLIRIKTTSINCQIERNPHPLGERYTPTDYLSSKVIQDPSIQDRLISMLRNIVIKIFLY